MQFHIRNCWSGEIQYTCELGAEFEGKSYSIQLGAAVKIGVAEKADLRAANLRDADLRDADLRAANLRDADLSAANLSAANLRDADLRAANLRDANLRDADLRAADLSAANLRDADLRAADLRADWVPKIPNIHQAVFEAASKPAALDMDSWHNSCGTAHCRAGWVVTLAGEGGRVLEGCWGTPAAAAAIYMASDPGLERVPNFYAGNDEALADMKRLAELEASKS